jgi:adenylate cyclase
VSAGTQSDFGAQVLRTYDDRRTRQDAVRKGLDLSVVASTTPYASAEIRTGHPIGDGLAIGQQRSCDMASLFLDLTDFTGRTFWDPPADVANLAHAILSAFTVLVEQCRGYVLGLRGDGLYAGFGPNDTARGACIPGLICAARALHEAETSLNPQLEDRDLVPVKVRAGIDWGNAVFVRSGTQSTNEVNVVGFTPNFAAKCEKKAKSWQVVAGEGLVNQMPSGDLFVDHEDSPKSYQREYQVRKYFFYDYRWRRLVKNLDSEIIGQRLPSISGL